MTVEISTLIRHMRKLLLYPKSGIDGTQDIVIDNIKRNDMLDMLDEFEEEDHAPQPKERS